MRYERIRPPEYLQGHVRYFWTLETDETTAVPQKFRIIADGCPGIIIHRAETAAFYQNEKKMPAICLYGQSTRFAELKSRGKFDAIGVQLLPNALRTVFGLRADQLTDSCLDLDELSNNGGATLSERLFEAASAEEKFDILIAYLFSQITENNLPPDRKIERAVTEIIRASGKISLRELQWELELTEKSLQRKFRTNVGLTPKIYSRICQFQASLDQLRRSDFANLSDIAYDNEYSDQSHFIRSFRQFAGFSPNQFQKNSRPVLENLTRIG